MLSPGDVIYADPLYKDGNPVEGQYRLRQLPEVSGLEVTTWIKKDQELKLIPVVAITAFAMKGDKERICCSGCEDYIAKPISVISLLQTVERFMSRTML